MNKPGETQSGNNSPKSNDQPKTGEAKSSLNLPKNDAVSDPKLKAHDQTGPNGNTASGNQANSNKDGNKIFQTHQDDSKKIANPSQQQQAGAAVAGNPNAAAWKANIGAAKLAWDKLTEDELTKSEGQAAKLSGLVKGRYAVSQDEADKQVKAFLDKNKA